MKGDLKCTQRQDPLDASSFHSSTSLGFTGMLTTKRSQTTTLSEGDTSSGARVFRVDTPAINYGEALLRTRKKLENLSPEYKKKVLGDFKDSVVVKQTPLSKIDEEDLERREGETHEEFAKRKKLMELDVFMDNEKVYNEIIVGHQLNRLRLEINELGVLCPQTHSFMLVYDWLKIGTAEGEEEVAMVENGKVSFHRWMLEKNQGPPNFAYMAQFNLFLFQLLHALEVGWNLCGFVHNDLHTGNVMIKEISTLRDKDWVFERSHPYSLESYPLRRKYVVANKDAILESSNVPIPLIIDYDRSRVQTPFGNADLKYDLVNGSEKSEKIVSEIICPYFIANDEAGIGTRSGSLQIDGEDRCVRIPLDLSRDMRVFSLNFITYDRDFVWKHCLGMKLSHTEIISLVGGTITPSRGFMLTPEYRTRVSPMLSVLLERTKHDVENMREDELMVLLTPDTSGAKVSRFGKRQSLLEDTHRVWAIFGTAGLVFQAVMANKKEIVEGMRLLCWTLLQMSCIKNWSDEIMGKWWYKSYYSLENCRENVLGSELKVLVFIRNFIKKNLETASLEQILAVSCCLFSLVGVWNPNVGVFILRQWAHNPVVYEHELSGIKTQTLAVKGDKIDGMVYRIQPTLTIGPNLVPDAKVLVTTSPTTVLDEMEKFYTPKSGWSVLNETEMKKYSRPSEIMATFTPIWNAGEDVEFAVIGNCFNCDHPAVKTCECCKNAVYCGTKCQEQHWEAGHCDECL